MAKESEHVEADWSVLLLIGLIALSVGLLIAIFQMGDAASELSLIGNAYHTFDPGSLMAFVGGCAMANFGLIITLFGFIQQGILNNRRLLKVLIYRTSTLSL